MMTVIYIVYSAVCFAVAAALLVVALHRACKARIAARSERLLAQRYVRMITALLISDEGAPMSRFAFCGRRGAKSVLARALASVSRSTCGDGCGVVRRIMAANGVEGWLLGRARRSRGYGRARYLSMLASLPVSVSTANFVGRYAGSRNRHIRFWAMMVRVVADPAAALYVLSTYPHRFTAYETAAITAVLRRGLLPLACYPLLTSPSHNLKALGLNIVRMFGMADAERFLMDIISDDADRDDVREAIFAVAAMHLPVTRGEIVARVRGMSLSERRSLCRRLACEGYSASVIMRLAANRDRHYMETLVASYKRSLVCCG
ncbi:MAG: hypothetical protein J6K28_01845 [Alistipes sp.]|nr:hypothetical protein [Alistipes sp.]